MTLRSITLVVGAALLVASCSTTSKPKNQQEIGSEFGQAKNVTYAAPVVPFEKPMHLVVGQHARYGIVDKDGKQSVASYGIIGREGDIWVLETYLKTAGKETTTQLKLAGLDKAMVSLSSDDVQIVSARTKNNNDPPTELDGVVLSLNKATYKDALVHMTMKITPTGKDEAITVPAGTFLGTMRGNVNLHIFGSWVPSTAYYHPDVPLSGLIKSTSATGVQMVLLDFGVTGAKASF